jgi:hypothetical protein
MRGKLSPGRGIACFLAATRPKTIALRIAHNTGLDKEPWPPALRRRFDAVAVVWRSYPLPRLSKSPGISRIQVRLTTNVPYASAARTPRTSAQPPAQRAGTHRALRTTVISAGNCLSGADLDHTHHCQLGCGCHHCSSSRGAPDSNRNSKRDDSPAARREPQSAFRTVCMWQRTSAARPAHRRTKRRRPAPSCGLPGKRHTGAVRRRLFGCKAVVRLR